LIKFIKTRSEIHELIKIRCWALALLIFILLVFGDKPAKAQDSDFRTWTKIRISTKIIPKLKFDLTQEFRLENNSSQFDEIFTNLNLAYSPFKFMEIAGSYRYIQHRKKSGDWIAQNRFHFDLNLIAEIKRFSPEYRFRIVRYPNFANDTKTGVTVLRHRLKLIYDIKNCKVDLYASAELFHALIDNEDDEIGQLRYTLGANYRFHKNHRIGLAFKYEQEYNVKKPETNYILAVDYKWYLKFKKKADKNKES
jgi:hypothetical protein